jgi:hypothetical protein
MASSPDDRFQPVQRNRQAPVNVTLNSMHRTTPLSKVRLALQRGTQANSCTGINKPTTFCELTSWISADYLISTLQSGAGGQIAIAPTKGSSMCALCGVLSGDDHWSDRPVPLFSGEPPTRRARRLARVSAANLVLAQLGLKLADWEGAKYQLSSSTGRTEIVDNLAQLWQAAERILGRACDPLDPSLIARMEQIRRTG